MKIYSMTATFGKLENQTLTLTPGLNVIEAPNEWGKSTWCAFLVNMLYGLDTRAKSTKTALADKDRYAPWSGAPMSGRIDLNWNGKDITIQRQTKGRLIFGDFSAYETDTGIPVDGMNGLNCGEMLLGVERSVFTRSGFLRFTDLPVTQDDALRRRLNNLVTTGDESGAGDRLQSTLRDLKNKCRFNRTGLLPAAESRRQQLDDQLQELDQLREQSASLQKQQKENDQRIRLLRNHKDALSYAAAQEDARKVAQAIGARDAAASICAQQERLCADLPSRQEAQQALHTAREMTRQQIALQAENQCLPPLPQQPEIPERFRQQTPEEAVGSAKADFASLQSLTAAKKKCNAFAAVWCIVAALLLAGLAAVWFMELFPETLVLLCAGGVIVLASIIALCVNGAKAKRLRKEKEQILSRHPHMSPDNWVSDAEDYAAKQASYAAALAQAQAIRGDLDVRTKEFSDALADFAGDEPLQDMIQRLETACDALDALENARRDLQKAEDHVITVQAMARTAQAPDFPDELELSEAETDEQLSRASFIRQQLQHKLGQAQGRAEALGQEANIRNQLKVENRRIEKLEDTYNALELALNVLNTATRELQRRFAPRITKRAQELFGQLTGGRYDKLMLGEDLSLSASTVEDTGLRSAQYRSDGTVDQLYLALRLAVAEELTPEAPLVLDDALVRFDDRRAAVAMDILREMGDHKQVILFTCQSRDNQL